MLDQRVRGATSRRVTRWSSVERSLDASFSSSSRRESLRRRTTVSAMLKSCKALAVVGLVVAASGCGDMATDSRSPVQLTILSMQAASGASPQDFGGTLLSDVTTNVERTVNGQQVD